MTPRGAAQPRARQEPQRPLPHSATTRDLLVELAAQVFATEGYASASVRDLGRRIGVTSGAIYGNFRGKADLLAEAVDARLTTDQWSWPEDVSSKSTLEMVADRFAHSSSREQLMSLLLEGAVAARVESEVRARLHEPIQRWIAASSGYLDGRSEAEGFAPGADLDTAVKLLWSIEIGLHALAALGIEPPTEQQSADTVRRFMTGLQGDDDAAPRRSRTRKPTAKPSRGASKGKGKAASKPTSKTAAKSASKKSTAKSSTRKPTARRASRG